MPANSLPYLAKERNNAVIIEVNPIHSAFTNKITDYYFPLKATDFLKN